jgi:hypothetical protein
MVRNEEENNKIIKKNNPAFIVSLETNLEVSKDKISAGLLQLTDGLINI